MTNEQITQIGLEALRQAYTTHQNLGIDGENKLDKNQFGEQVYKIDLAISEAMINHLREINFPARVISEELGTIDLAEDPTYLVVIDGLDGSDVYLESRGKGRYGTMLCIFNGIDPVYDDYIFNGTMEHSANRLYYAAKDMGAHVITEGDDQPAPTLATVTQLDNVELTYIDEYYVVTVDEYSNKLIEYPTECTRSSAIHYSDFLAGRIPLVLECTRKKNLEIAVAYGMVKEAGGIMETLDGTPLGPEKYMTFAQDDQVPLITAVNKELADDLREYLKSR